jgi:ABC-type antimicrobial peptide transport system permease subunit
VVIGLAGGLVTVFVLGRALHSELFEVAAFEPMVILTISLILSTVAFAAALIPAFRASRVDPVEALRSE